MIWKEIKLQLTHIYTYILKSRQLHEAWEQKPLYIFSYSNQVWAILKLEMDPMNHLYLILKEN